MIIYTNIEISTINITHNYETTSTFDLLCSPFATYGRGELYRLEQEV